MKEINYEDIQKMKNDDESLPTGMLGKIRFRLNLYGGKSFSSVRSLVNTAREVILNLASALAGSIILLPFVILIRGFYVLFNTFFQFLKPLTLSLLRFIFDTVKNILWPLRQVVVKFNEDLLYPLITRIREDDTVALVALAVLFVVIAITVAVLSYVF